MVEWENQRYPYTWPWVRIPHFLERVGQSHRRCGNRTDLAPIPSPSITIVARKRKFEKKNVGTTKVRIFKFLNENVKGDIEYSHTNFIVRSTLGHWYPVDDSTGVYHLHYSVNVLGWMEDPLIPCSYIQLPHAQSYNKTTSPQFLESDFMDFSPTMKTYHLPDSGGSYISRYRSISSHIKLTLFLKESKYYSIYFTTIL